MVAFAFNKHIRGKVSIYGIQRGDKRSKIRVKLKANYLAHFVAKERLTGG